jgi:MerR family transcriptional regulator, light-induced transcriptional regulator
MNRYSINDLEKITGIKAHTIRMWEKRYGIIEPQRTSTNIRFYSDRDLKKLMNISTLNKNGIKISEIVDLSTNQICEKIIELNSSGGAIDTFINNLIIATVELNELLFNKILTSSIIKVGLEKTYITVLQPFLEKIGIMWQAGSINPAQEHFITNLIRQKLIVAIDNLDETNDITSKKFILFLPDNERHELGLLFYNYLLKKAGNKIFYLGQSVPLNDLKKIQQIVKADYLLTIFTTGQTNKQFQSIITKLSELIPDNIYFISGLQVKEQEIDFPKNVIPFTNFEELKSNL